MHCCGAARRGNYRPHKMTVSTKSLFYVTVSLLGFLFTFATVHDLVSFLSNSNREQRCWGATLIRRADPVESTSITTALLVDATLLILFMAQHSVLKMHTITHVLEQWDLVPIGRSIYVIATSAMLQALMCFWIRTPAAQLWSVKNPSWQWFFYATHIYAWIVVYMGSITMDMVELLGLKQVYYALKGLPNPLSVKSSELQRLYKHMRHPSFLGFFLIFVACPEMTADRFLMTIVWTIYMAVMWKNDARDYYYQKEQLNRKRFTLAFACNR